MTAPITITEEFARALDLLRDGRCLFLTGRAGTGKSTLIRHFLGTTDRRAITVAPTGIAALNVDGYTIHRLFSFRPGVDAEFVRSAAYFPGRFARALGELDTLIVDEASMVRADLFDAMVAALERFGPHPGEPFGGVQLVLVGDLYQLPPVVADAEAEHIETVYGTPYFFSGAAFDREAFAVVELTTVFRQVGDTRLVNLLNAVREGELLDAARTELNERVVEGFEPPDGEFWLTLATTNRIVAARNTRMLERLPDAPRTFTARQTGEIDGFEIPADTELSLAVGAQVMMLSNDPSDRWANGTLGHVVRLGEADGEGEVDVRLRDGRIVAVGPHTWEITRPVARGGRLEHEVVGTFRQLPMKLAWAITIHKSQGQTLDRVVVDLTGGTFANGQLYVALSRCTSLEGLVLRRPVLPRDLKTDARIRRFLASADVTAEDHGHVCIAALTVGKSGDRYRPRPVEIAMVTDDGDEATTVVNPTSDLYRAQTDYGLTTRDVQLAPLLAEAWSALAPIAAGRVPVGHRIDETLGLIDFELKRNGIVARLPLGIELPESLITVCDAEALRAPTALERARAVRDIVQRQHGAGEGLSPAGASAFPIQTQGRGYLLARSTGAGAVTEPSGFVVGGNLSPEDDPAQVLAELLTGAWGRVVDRDAVVIERVRGVEQHFDVQVLAEDVAAADDLDLPAILVPGARVCFTGTVVDAQGRTIDRDRMEAIAQSCGLVAAPSVTKTRTDVLVVAERGTQSGKAKKAAAWGKPVIAAEDFLAWAGLRG